MIRNIVVVAFAGGQVLDIVGPMEVFDGANHLTDKPVYRVVCVSEGSGLVQVSNGLTLAPMHYQDWGGKIDTLIVPGSSEQNLAALRSNTRFIEWLRRRLQGARRVVSVCTGAFVLGELGFLHERRASTYQAACDRLRAFSPTTEVDEDAIYTKYGNVYTSAGVTAGIDLALSLIEEDLGKAASLGVARNLVLYLRRPGGLISTSEVS